MQIPDGWVEHDGGPCPVNLCQFVPVMFRSRKQSNTAPAFHWIDRWSNRWEHIGPFRNEDIIAYKPETSND